MARRSQFEIWVDTFRPKKNALNLRACDDGTRFETSGDELAAVQAANKSAPGTVWTMVDCDGKLYISQGFHFVNRMGYFITEVAFDPAIAVQVKRYQHKDVVY